MIALKTAQGVQLGEMLQFVTFDLVNAREKPLVMALNVQKVKEVVEFSSLSSMPMGCESILGIYDLRGCAIPVVDILTILTNSKTTSTYGKNARILICELQNVWVGIPVEKTGRIITCSSSQFLPPPVGTKIETRKIITGLIRKDNSYVPVLDLDSILDSIGFSVDPMPTADISPLYLGKRILIVDDSRVILKKLDRLFLQLGCKVDLAENGAEALKKLREVSRYDLIFTDIEMPILDGIAMAREIKSNPQYSNIPILFNSALSNPALISDIENEKLGRYLVKFDTDLILKQLQIVFFNAAPASSAASRS